MDDLPVRGEWVVGVTAAMLIRCLMWLSVFGAVLLVVLAVRSRPKRRN
jgi:hypothetical protein